MAAARASTGSAASGSGRLEQEALMTVAQSERWHAALAAAPRVVMQESHAQYALELARRFGKKSLTFMLVKEKRANPQRTPHGADAVWESAPRVRHQCDPFGDGPGPNGLYKDADVPRVVCVELTELVGGEDALVRPCHVSQRFRWRPF
jgi:hypothetical protein